MAICGRDCSITVDGATFEGHSYSISTSSEENDVRVFGSGDYGAWLACAKNGTVTINSYANCGVVSGDVADIVAVIGSPAVLTLTMASAVCTTWDVNVDAKGIVEFTTNWRIVGDVAGI